MANIGHKEWKACYQAAIRVLEKGTQIADEVRFVVTHESMNAGSARDYIDGFIHLYRGESYTRTMSFNGTIYFLDKIVERYGQECEYRACHAVLEHIEYYRNLEKGGFQRKLLNEINNRLAELSLKERTLQTLSQYHKNLEESVAKALKDEKSIRKGRLIAAPKLPSEKTVTAKVFIRNPDVIAEVLEHAAGKCEYCKSSAPFNRKSNGTPFLEVHHRLPLAEGGEDTVENAIALCPNCHREAHYGTEWKKFRP